MKFRLKSAVTAAVLAIVFLLAGCASQDEPDAITGQTVQCPPNTTMRCFKRTAETQECSCVNKQKIETLLER
ncbi:MAG: hypothetical protein ACR2QX_09460 [Woeseiaceae bacterium]